MAGDKCLIVVTLTASTASFTSSQTVPFAAGGIHEFGATVHKRIRRLKQAKARADGDIQAKTPHSCDTKKCEPWPENP